MQGLAGLVLAILIGALGWSYWLVLVAGGLIAWGAYSHNSKGGSAMGILPMTIIGSLFAFGFAFIASFVVELF